MKIISVTLLASTACFGLAACQTASESSKATSFVSTSALKDKPVKSRKSGAKRPYEDLIRAHAKANGVPANLAFAVVSVESDFRAHVRGRAGEVGLMQIKPATARGMGYRGSVKALYNPSTNLKYGMRYLGKAHKMSGGNLCGTILRYNAGHYAKRMNPVSAAYCRKVKKRL